MFTPTEWTELARACRALAHHLDQTAESLKGTSVQAATIKEAKRFREYAQRCEEEGKRSG